MDRKLKEEIAALHAQICNALSNPSRILLICLLADGPRNVGELTEELNLSQPTTSRHLKVLMDKGLIYAERQGQFVVYQLADRRVIQALEILRGMVADMLQGQGELAHTVKDRSLTSLSL